MHKDHELHKRRRGRNAAMLVVALALVGLIFAVTIVKLGGTGAELHRPG